MPVSSYRFKIELDSKGLIAEARRIRAELEKELGRGFDFRQAKQEMGDIADLSQTTGAHVVAMGQGLKGVTQESGQMVVDLEQADDATRRMLSDLFRTGASARELEQALRGTKDPVEETRQEVKWLGRDLEEVAKMSRMERFGAAMGAAARETYGLRTLGRGVERAGRGMMMTGMGIIGPLALAGRQYLEFADDANRAGRQLKLNADLTDELKSETLELSASLGLFAPEQISQGLYTWASAIGAVAESQEDLDRLLKDSVEIQKLAAMNQEQLGATTEYVAAILGEFGMDVSQTKRVVALLNFTADRTQATVSDLGQSFKFVGPMAAALGEDIEDVAAILGVAADAGIKQSQAGRAVRQMYIRLTKPTKEMNKAFNEALGLSEELGQSWEDIVFQGGKFIGTANFIDLLAAATENMTDQQRMALLAQLATANELPVLTALVLDQIEAREQGINSMRAWKKQAIGNIDAEVEKYAEWREATKGITVSLEDAHEAWAREWLMYEESDTARADRMAKRWSAAWLRIGKTAVETALPMLEQLADGLDRISRHIERHPEAVGAALKTGAILTGVGAFVAAAGKGVRLYADIKMVAAAATMFAASKNMLVAAGMQQTATGGRLLGGLSGLGGKLLGGVGGLGGLLGGAALIAAPLAGFEAVHQARNLYYRATGEEVKGEMETLAELWDTIRISAAGIAGGGGMLAAALLGEDLAEGFEIATYEAGKLFGLVEETGVAMGYARHQARGTRRELMGLPGPLREARGEARGLGHELMQVPDAAAGLAAFTEAELEAIDELESYLRSRNEMIEKHNDDLVDMEQDFLDKQADYYQDYLDKRSDLEAELRETTEDPLWQMTRDVQKSEKRIEKAIEDYNRRIANAIEDHQRKLRNLQEGHDDKMENLEASRDAKGILAERRRYGRAVRDAQEHHEGILESAEDRLNEVIENEREKLATMRQERKEDLEEKLRELDENYLKEEQKRKKAHDKAYADRQQAQAQELLQLDRAHSERLARIIGWEEQVRDELRRGYIRRQEDLHRHLAQMRAEYASFYGMAATMAMTPEEYRAWHEQERGHQMGGYAPAGLYRLGEAGEEYVLTAPTTRALERAIGHLSQSKILNMAGGRSGGHYRLDVRVTADDHFSPAFAAQTEAIVMEKIVELSVQATRSQPGAYRPH